jgi:hypothetical protein
MLRIINGSNKLYGLPEADVKFGETHPTVNDELLYKIRHGKVHPKGDMERFEGQTVHFKDGSQEEFDAVIACTGFVLVHPFFDQSFLDYSSGPVPSSVSEFVLYRHVSAVGLHLAGRRIAEQDHGARTGWQVAASGEYRGAL